MKDAPKSTRARDRPPLPTSGLLACANRPHPQRFSTTDDGAPAAPHPAFPRTKSCSSGLPQLPGSLPTLDALNQAPERGRRSAAVAEADLCDEGHCAFSSLSSGSPGCPRRHVRRTSWLRTLSWNTCRGASALIRASSHSCSARNTSLCSTILSNRRDSALRMGAALGHAGIHRAHPTGV